MISCGTEYRYTNILDNLNHSIRDFWRKKKIMKKMCTPQENKCR